MNKISLYAVFAGSLLLGNGLLQGDSEDATRAKLRQAIDEADSKTVARMKRDGILSGAVLEYGREMFNRTYERRAYDSGYEFFDRIANPARKITNQSGGAGGHPTVTEQRIYQNLRSIMIDLGLWQ